VIKPPTPGRRPGFPHWGPAPLFSRARARRSEGPARIALLLASRCREVCPGQPSPARGPPSPSFTGPSFTGWRCALILRTGLQVGPNRNCPTPRASVEGQPSGSWGRSRESCRQGSGSHNLERVEGSPTSVQPQVPKPRQCASTPPRLIAHTCALKKTKFLFHALDPFVSDRQRKNCAALRSR
jgi:hypothetical protein